MKKNFLILFLGAFLMILSGCAQEEAEKIFASRFTMKGIVVDVNEAADRDWVELARTNGINTISLKGDPSALVEFVNTDKGLELIGGCESCGIDLEYHLCEDTGALECQGFQAYAEYVMSYFKQLRPTNHLYYWKKDLPCETCRRSNDCAKEASCGRRLAVEKNLLKSLREMDPQAKLALVIDDPLQFEKPLVDGIFVLYEGDVEALKGQLPGTVAENMVVAGQLSDPQKLDVIAECGIRNVTAEASLASEESLFEYGRGLNLVKIESMTHPWGDVFQETETTVSLIGDNLHLRFDAVDTEIIYDETFEYERDMEIGDRIEAYFSKDRELTGYYGFEVDPVGNVMAYKCKYFKQFEYEWDAPEGFWAKGYIKDNGYVVDVSIPMEFINTMVIDGNIYIGLYRADYRRVGDEVVRDSYSWRDPGNGIHTFHQPEIFYHVALF